MSRTCTRIPRPRAAKGNVSAGEALRLHALPVQSGCRSVLTLPDDEHEFALVTAALHEFMRRCDIIH